MPPEQKGRAWPSAARHGGGWALEVVERQGGCKPGEVGSADIHAGTGGGGQRAFQDCGAAVVIWWALMSC
jgi:hypothetical protein